MFVVLESKNLNPTQGFEHVKRYAGLAAGKPRGCSEHVFILYIYILCIYYFTISWYFRKTKPPQPTPRKQVAVHSAHACFEGTRCYRPRPSSSSVGPNGIISFASLRTQCKARNIANGIT